MCELLKTEQGARWLGLSPRTLEKMRCEGGGPPFRKHGRLVFYHEDDLRAWSEAQTRRSTSDPGEGQEVA